MLPLKPHTVGHLPSLGGGGTRGALPRAWLRWEVGQLWLCWSTPASVDSTAELLCGQLYLTWLDGRRFSEV